MRAIDPATLVRAAHAHGAFHHIHHAPFALIAAGKAARPMASAIHDLFAAQAEHGLVAGPDVPSAELPARWDVRNPAHPFPDAESVHAGQAALHLAHAARGGPLVVMLSGGASSMLCVPADGITLEDKILTSKALMHAGVGIAGLNCVRKHLSAIKGGQLGASAGRVLTLAISDVHHPVPDEPSVIGSGPTVPDPTSFAQALAIAAGAPGIPPAVMRRLEDGAAGKIAETIKPGDARLAGAEFTVIGNRETALEGAARAAEGAGYSVAILERVTHGEAREAAWEFMDGAAHLSRQFERPLCVLAAGETTVRVSGRGIGGRNQEFALAAAPFLPDLGTPAAVACIGTDGVDGPTNAAGALSDSTTMERAASAGLDPEGALANNDTYPFFAALDDLIISGPTGTNVGDVQVLLLCGRRAL